MQGIPECSKCHTKGDKEWHLMNAAEKRQWTIVHGDELICASCNVMTDEERRRYERDRQYYNRAKKELYPKKNYKERLKRLKSDEKWEGTRSFFESWRPPSSLAHLVDSGKGEGRKGTGYVKPTTNGETDEKKNSTNSENSFEILHEDLDMTIVEEEMLSSAENTADESIYAAFNGKTS